MKIENKASEPNKQQNSNEFPYRYTWTHEDGTEEKKVVCVDVDGTQVFSADYVFRKMQCQMKYIDEVDTLAKFALIMSILSICTSILIAVIMC